MNDLSLPSLQPSTFGQWFARKLRCIANHIEAQDARPSLVDIEKEKLRATREALLDAEAEFERQLFTTAMLRTRVHRLTNK